MGKHIEKNRTIKLRSAQARLRQAAQLLEEIAKEDHRLHAAVGDTMKTGERKRWLRLQEAEGYRKMADLIWEKVG